MQLSPRTFNYILEGERERERQELSPRLLQDALHKIITRNFDKKL